ncbi:MAG: hypothetical protein ISS95_00900, partial [Candidatus Aenigmarchaeota archaeon]|nr:hypothetical protein [Candidatus Aenigmarchaeota archaeon]
MDKDGLKRLAAKEKVPLGMIEKDYVLSSVLFVISQLPISKQIVFKGGTAIKKIYYP